MLVPPSQHTDDASAENDLSPVAMHGWLRVDGNKIVGEHGDPVQLSGIGHSWSSRGWEGEKFYTDGAVAALINDWKASVVRAAMAVEVEGGYLSAPSYNVQLVKTVVDAAIRRNAYVIVDFHSHAAEKYVDQAIEFFKSMAREYGDKPHVLFEIYNEPPDKVDWKTVKRYAEKVIPAIRSHGGRDSIVLVGTPRWCQELPKAAMDPLDPAKYGNVAYTAHFYAWSHHELYRSKVEKAVLGDDYRQSGDSHRAAEWRKEEQHFKIPVVVTEWGAAGHWGGGHIKKYEVDAWMRFLDKLGISHVAFSLVDKPETDSALRPGADPNGDWPATALTPAGDIYRSIILADQLRDRALYAARRVRGLRSFSSRNDTSTTPTPRLRGGGGAERSHSHSHSHRTGGHHHHHDA